MEQDNTNGLLLENNEGDEEFHFCDLEDKQAYLRQYTQDQDILSHAEEMALDNCDVLALLKKGAKKIYLYEDEFLVPIDAKGVSFIGIGQATVVSYYVEEEYELNGTSFENISLSQPKQDGYDRNIPPRSLFNDCLLRLRHYSTKINASLLAASFREKVKVEQRKCSFSTNEDLRLLLCNYHTDKEVAVDELQKTIDRAYDYARVFFDIGMKGNIARKLALAYGVHLRELSSVIKLFRPLTINKRADWLVNDLDRVLGESVRFLRLDFEDELKQNAEIYQIDRGFVRIHGCKGGIAGCAAEEAQEVVQKIYREAQRRTDAFCEVAFSLYQQHCCRIENIAEELGNELNDDDMSRSGIFKALTTTHVD